MLPCIYSLIAFADDLADVSTAKACCFAVALECVRKNFAERLRITHRFFYTSFTKNIIA